MVSHSRMFLVAPSVEHDARETWEPVRSSSMQIFLRHLCMNWPNQPLSLVRIGRRKHSYLLHRVDLETKLSIGIVSTRGLTVSRWLYSIMASDFYCINAGALQRDV